MTLAGTIDPPPYAAALFGAVFQMSTIFYVWGSYTSAKECLKDPIGCLGNFSQSDVFGRLIVIVFCSGLFVWVISLLPFLKGGTHSDPSIVDRLWSIQPVVYCWYFVLCAENVSTRLLVMAVVTTVWGVRLTTNFALKGGFSGGEDYRWKEIRSWFPGWKYELFHLLFVCLFQQLLIFSFTVPIVSAFKSNEEFGVLDVVITVIHLTLVLGETVADWQMMVYQTEKYRRKNAGEPMGEYERGFIETGLWQYSRHPNYFCEVSLWWTFYLFSIPATGDVLNWTILGPIFLTLLFVPPRASLDVTEALSSRKYAAYPEYQQRVARFIPWIPKSKSE